MAYVQSNKVMKKRLQEKRRVSGAALLREELNNDAAAGNGSTSASLLDDLPAFEQNKGVMLANFEEWIKMATDNKINTTNSWNFALIDYFHDMNVLRESDNNINFQKASATLDGCVKIYSSRVDSVATETGRLLSGLATRKSDSPDIDEHNDDEDQQDGDEDDEDLDPTQPKKRSKSRKTKDSESTLTTFENIKIKKLTQELSIDPLFKKTLAEFDEGGAKSLLLNTLHMDANSRVVFDASATASNDDEEQKQKDVKLEAIQEEDEDEDLNLSGDDEQDDDEQVVDISSLKQFLFRFDDIGGEMDGMTLCPSMPHLDSVLKDINKAKSILTEFNVEDTVQNYESNNGAYDDYDMNGGGDDGGMDLDYGDFGGNENENSYGELDDEAAAVIFGDGADSHNEEAVGDDTGVVNSIVDQDLMAYFDNTLKRNWAGPEHWKVKQLKKGRVSEVQAGEKGSTTKAKKVKEIFSVNFLDITEEALEDEKTIFSKGRGQTTLPQAEWETNESHLLPDDMNFSSEVLTKLFLKPTQRMNLFRKKVIATEKNEEDGGDDYKQAEATIWNQNYKDQEQEVLQRPDIEPDNDDDDDSYGAGDFDGGMDFGFDDLPPSTADDKAQSGTQLITGGARAKPGYVNYSKKAKNVNVKKLKDNIWKSIEVKKEDNGERQFSDIVGDVGKMYPREQKKELSTSFCFICLLHLANEHGFTIENGDELKDLKVTGLSEVNDEATDTA